MTEALPILVIGAGFAGLSAVAALRAEGESVTLLSLGVGASQMTSGAVDLFPWAEAISSRERDAFSADVRIAFDLGQAWDIFAEGPAVVATPLGLVRPSFGVGARVLNLSAHRGKVIAVATWRRADWDPDALSRAYAASDWAVATGTRFVALDLPGVFSDDELRYPAAHFSRLLSDLTRVEALETALVRAKLQAPEVSAFLVGPWLGSGTQEILAGGVACGETLSPPEGAYGVRVEQAHSAWLAREGVEFHKARIVRLESDAGVVTAYGVNAFGEELTPCRGRAVIVGTGGMVSGGVVMTSGGLRPALSGLLPAAPMIFGASADGWDPCEGGGAWIAPPHTRQALTRSARSHSHDVPPALLRVDAGDVRGVTPGGVPHGTVLGSMISGRRAALEILAFLRSQRSLDDW